MRDPGVMMHTPKGWVASTPEFARDYLRFHPEIEHFDIELEEYTVFADDKPVRTFSAGGYIPTPKKVIRDTQSYRQDFEEHSAAYTLKMAKNFMRKWPPSRGEDHAIMHIKDPEGLVDATEALVAALPPDVQKDAFGEINLAAGGRVEGGTIILNITDAQAREMSRSELRARSIQLWSPDRGPY